MHVQWGLDLHLQQIASPALAISIIAQLAAVYKLSYGAPDTLEVLTICLSLVASIVFVGLSAAEHRLTVKPSSLIVLYLLATAGCDAFELTYPGPAEAAGMDGQTRAELTILAALARLVLLVLECLNKTSALAPKYRSLPPEETAGLLSKTFFWWVMDMLVIGTKRLLRIEDIPQLPTRVQGRPLRGAILKHWGRRGERDGLFLAFVANLKKRQARDQLHIAQDAGPMSDNTCSGTRRSPSVSRRVSMQPARAHSTSHELRVSYTTNG